MSVFNNVLAIEGEWYDNLKRKETIKSTLSLLEEVCDLKYIYRQVNTSDGLLNYLKESRKNCYQKYDIIFLAFHGTRKDIEIATGEYLTLEDLGIACEGYFEDKYVHFSSCDLGNNESALDVFRIITGAKAVSAYSASVDFFDSSIFDLLLMQKLRHYKRLGSLKNHLEEKYNYLYNRLGFVMVR